MQRQNYESLIAPYISDPNWYQMISVQLLIVITTKNCCCN